MKNRAGIHPRLAMAFASSACVLLLLLAPLLRAHPLSQPTPRSQTAASAKGAAQSDGERLFRQHCSRCHDAPQSFPSQISGTVLRHMRIRASLSANGEKELLKFLNP